MGRRTAAKLRAGRLTDLDRENIAEELASLAGASRRELVERLARLLQNLLQWEYLDGLRLPVWYAAIEEERDMILRLLDDAPSPNRNWPGTYLQAWGIARENVRNTTGLAAVALPQVCSYRSEDALALTFWPGCSGRRIIRPTEEEEIAIQRGIAADPDNPEWTAADVAKARCLKRIKLPTPEEDPAIQSGIEADSDTFVPTDEQFAKERRRGKSK